MTNNKSPLPSLRLLDNQLTGARIMAQAFGIKGGLVPGVLQDQITDLEYKKPEILKSELHDANILAKQYESSNSRVPEQLNEHILNLEAKLAELNPPVGKEIVGG